MSHCHRGTCTTPLWGLAVRYMSLIAIGEHVETPLVGVLLFRYMSLIAIGEHVETPLVGVLLFRGK